MDLYGQLDLTKLGQIVRQHPDAVRVVNFKDGQHKMLNINIYANDKPDQYGNSHCITAGVKKEARLQELSYYIANLRPSNGGVKAQQPAQATQQAPQQSASPDSSGELPF